MTLPSTNAVLPIFSCTMSFIWSFIARDPVHLFLFAQWIRPTHIFCWFPPTLFFSNICLAELGPSFTAEDLWNICEISMKYLWNIWKIFMKYLWNICVMLWNICEILVIYLWNFTIFSNMCTTEVALSSSTENCTAKNWLIYFFVNSYMYRIRCIRDHENLISNYFPTRFKFLLVVWEAEAEV